MKMRSLLILLALLGGLALWSNWPAPVIAQQAVDHDDHAGHDHDAAKADEHEGHDHADHDVADGADGAGHADEHDDHADHDHGGEADEHDDEGHAGHEGADDHAEHGDDEDGHDDHAGHGHEEEEGGIRIAPEVMREFGIEVRSADGGHIEKVVRLPGEVVFNADRIAHVTPTVAGIVRKVNFSVGDQVKAGQEMAVLNSQELAAARSEFLAAKARLALAEESLGAKEDLYESRIKLAKQTADRDARLLQDKVGTERQLLESQQALEEARLDQKLGLTEASLQVKEARIAMNQAENALHALGYSHDQIAKIETLEDTEFNTYELSSPLGGMVTARHVTVGEVIEPGNGSPFVVADLSTVWVNLTVYQRDLAHVQSGQHVTIRFGHGIPDAEGEIAFISPSLDETTRTATARIVLKNPDGHWRPGLFVEGRIETGRASASVVVPRSAITEMDGEQVVFVQTDEGFEPREVTVGRTTPESAEIVTGLKPGERFVAANVLALKAEMNRAALEHAGHAH